MNVVLLYVTSDPKGFRNNSWNSRRDDRLVSDVSKGNQALIGCEMD
jgi:hypothetical protein